MISKTEKTRVLTCLLLEFIFISAGKGYTLLISRNGQYKDFYQRTIEIPQQNRIVITNCYLKGHNVHLKLALPISG